MSQYTLLVDPSSRRGRDSLRCLMAAAICQVKVELVKDKSEIILVRILLFAFYRIKYSATFSIY